jgi:hypothetical protein
MVLPLPQDNRHIRNSFLCLIVLPLPQDNRHIRKSFLRLMVLPLPQVNRHSRSRIYKFFSQSKCGFASTPESFQVAYREFYWTKWFPVSFDKHCNTAEKQLRLIFKTEYI